MKRGRVIVLGIAFAAALGAALIARNMVSGPGEVRTVEKTVGATQVLVAAQDIDLGDSIDAADLRWQEWPEKGITPDFIIQQNDADAIEQLAGSVARAPFVADEPILRDKLVKLGEGGVLAAILPSGMRAVSTPISEESAAAGFILPNDRVDVILSREITVGSKEQQVSETVLQNVRVLAIGQQLETQGDQKVVSGATATLELTPRQAEVLSLARSMGPLSLSLRSLADAKRKPGEATADLDREGRGSVRMLKYGVPSQVFGVN
ncbi:Flp pilus assembly protein CpaB [Methyloligella sp. 2.7D]|uniref:Flp pilus assembly protein CpaB n=1 Tax=unclassified Methyloligella TaxID=2625955 RepID=UPI00157D7E39|nr:Flp pilus assembly protein CpaB [Methyloligella sp. GL2]QKP78588.1 Flp pilus assembly protein CpaB [Methyloligella sp. GL2]